MIFYELFCFALKIDIIQFIEFHFIISVPGLLLRHVEVHGEAAHLVLPLTHDPAEEKANYV